MKILMRKGLLYGFIFTSFFSCESNELVKQDHELGFCKSSAKSGLILVKTKRVFSKSLILNYYENT